MQLSDKVRVFFSPLPALEQMISLEGDEEGTDAFFLAAIRV